MSKTAVRPILFSAPMIRAIQREIEKPGTGKTQTRRTLSAENLRIWSGGLDFPGKNVKWPAPEFAEMMARNAREFRLIEGIVTWKTDPAPHRGGAAFASWQGRLAYSVGDVLWVRESGVELDRRHRMVSTRREYAYAADTKPGSDGDDIRKEYGYKWTPSIHMPRWASRLTLEVTDVRIERLQDISEADAIAEGVCQFCEDSDRPRSWEGLSADDRAAMVRAMYGSAVRAYSHLWDTINGVGAWDTNPWICAVSFVPHAMNVDAFLAQKEAA